MEYYIFVSTKAIDNNKIKKYYLHSGDVGIFATTSAIVLKPKKETYMDIVPNTN